MRWALPHRLWQRDGVPARFRRFATGRGPVIVAWLLLATGDVFADALRDTDPIFRRWTSVGLWLVWGMVLVVLVLPGPVALVIARTAVTAATPATAWALLAVDGSGDAVHLAQMAFAVLAGLAVLSPVAAERFIDAASYGDERRFLLRPPLPVAVFALVPTWAISVAGLTAGPLLLADERWAVGAVVSALGIPAALLALRAMHSLARRWLVFVPAGLVVHDHMALAEPVLVRRQSIRTLAPAPADSASTDLTARATGLALEISLRDPVAASVATGRRAARETQLMGLLVTPSRPGSVMAEAGRRRIPVT